MIAVLWAYLAVVQWQHHHVRSAVVWAAVCVADLVSQLKPKKEDS